MKPKTPPAPRSEPRRAAPVPRPAPASLRLSDTDRELVQRVAEAADTSRHDAMLEALRLGLRERARQLRLRVEGQAA